MKVGSVQAMELGAGAVEVTLRIDEKVVLREDCAVTVGTISLLGGSCVQIAEGGQAELETLKDRCGDGVTAALRELCDLGLVTSETTALRRLSDKLVRRVSLAVPPEEAMAYLGLFYAEKILGAIDIRIFNETKDESYRESSVAHLEQSADYFDQYAEIISANYEPQRLARVGDFDVNAIAESVREDVTIAEEWKPRTIRPSYRPPHKSDYFAETEE